MLKYNFLIFVVILFFFSCEKEIEPIHNDIVYTDEYGNIIKESNSKDWTLMGIDDNEIFYPLSTTSYGTNGEPLIPDYNFNCNSDDLSIIVYPNPVLPGQDCFLKISNNSEFIDFRMAYGKIDGNGSGLIGGINSVVSNNDHSEILLKLGDQLNWPKGNAEIYLFLLTEDSCAFYSYGKILYE